MGLLAGCRAAGLRQSPTSTPSPAASPTPTGHPSRLTRVVHTHHAGAWDGDELAPPVVRQMLDASVTALTGLDDAGAAWASLFRPEERVAIKVNAVTYSNVWTHAPLVMTLAQCLQDAAVPAEQITVFDRRTNELETAGFPINEDGPGVRCYGSETSYTGGYSIMETNIRLSDILLDCDALINVPILKYHNHAGMTFAMKNHFGSFDRPSVFHSPRTGQALAELNALPAIRDRTRLVIGDALSMCPTPNWNHTVRTSSFLMSRDPVAHEAVGLELLSQALEAQDLEPASVRATVDEWLATCSQLGLGTHDLDQIDVVRLDLEA